MDAKDILKVLNKKTKQKKLTGWPDKVSRQVTRLSDVAQILNSLSGGAKYTTSI